MKYKKLLLVLLSLIMVFTLSACGKGKKDKAPEITQVEKENELKTILKKQNYVFDSLENIKFKDSETNETDMTKLKQLFDHQIPYLKNDVNVTMSTNASSSAAQFSIIYAYYNDAWKAVISYPINEKGWVSEAKSRVNKKRIMEDLKEMELKGFKKGSIGKESNTKVILNNRDEKIDIGRDILFTTVVVKTDFAKYNIDIDFTYQFEDNDWVLKKTNIQDQKLWQIKYDKKNVPDALSQEAVIKKLTNKKNFLTYVTNKDYATNTMLSETRQSVGVDELSYLFSWITEYKDIAKVTYKVSMPYKFSDGEWEEGKQKITVDNVNVEEMVGKWTGENGDEIVFEKTLKSKKTDNRDVVTGTYYSVREIPVEKVDPSTDPFNTGLNEEEEVNDETDEIDPDDPLGENKNTDDKLSSNDVFKIKEEIKLFHEKIAETEIKNLTEFDKEYKKIEKRLGNDQKLKDELIKNKNFFYSTITKDMRFEGVKDRIGTEYIKNEKDLEPYFDKIRMSDAEKLELKSMANQKSEAKQAETKKVKAEYNIRLKLEADKKDDGWNLKILKFEPKNTSSVKFDIENANVDLKNKYIIIDGVKYSKKPFEEEKPEPEVPEEPEAVGKNNAMKIDSMDVEVPAYVIENENYFKIRDLAYALKDTKAKFKVIYDTKIKSIVVESGGDYEPMEGDMEPIKNPKSIGVRSYDKLFVNGHEEEIKAYKIEGFNYFRLRDLGDILGFGVDYDFENNKVVISSEISLEDLEKQKEKNRANDKDVDYSEKDVDDSEDEDLPSDDKNEDDSEEEDSNDTSAFDSEFNTDKKDKKNKEDKEDKNDNDNNDDENKK